MTIVAFCLAVMGILVSSDNAATLMLDGGETPEVARHKDLNSSKLQI